MLESNGAYVVRHHYFPQRRGRYAYVLDWEAVADPRAENMATSAYKMMSGLARNYPDHYGIVSSDEFLSRHRSFLFLDEHHMSWGNVWLDSLPGARAKRVGRVDGKNLLRVDLSAASPETRPQRSVGAP